MFRLAPKYSYIDLGQTLASNGFWWQIFNICQRILQGVAEWLNLHILGYKYYIDKP